MWAMEVEVQGKRNIGMPKRRWLDRVNDDIKEKELSGEEVKHRPHIKVGLSFKGKKKKIFLWYLRQSPLVSTAIYSQHICSAELSTLL